MELFILFFILGFVIGCIVSKSKHKQGNLLLTRDNEGIYAFMELKIDMEKIWNSKDITLKIMHKSIEDKSAQE